MMRTLALALVAGTALVSCRTATDRPYQPVTKAEDIEFEHARLTVYPNDVRTNLAQYTNTLVAWAGVIRSIDAIEEDSGGKIHAAAVLEHHYFDWEQDKTPHGIELLLSPTGEGAFRANLHLRKGIPDVTADDAEKYTGLGKLAIVYGVPESVDPDGTVVLKYHYVRTFTRGEYNTYELEYSRLGQPFRPGGWDDTRVSGPTNAP